MHLLMMWNNNRVTRNYFENLVTALKNGLVDVKTRPTESETTNEVDVKTRMTESETTNEVIDNWYCSRCTFLNDESSTECDACDEPR